MKRLERTIAALTLISLLTPGLSRIGHAQGVKVDQKTYTIAGAVGVPGATLAGLPGNIVSDRNGQYNAEVPYGWSGKVAPTKAGYSFEPPWREYSKVEANLSSEDYTARVVTFTISGSTGLPGVALQGLPGEPESDAKGYYTAKVEYGWTGVVTPHKEGCDFEPASRQYNAIVKDFPRQDYKAAVRMITITDTLRMGDGQPIPDVRVTAEPGGYSAATNVAGTYTLKVPYGWSGTVTFSKEGYEFNPPAYSYQNLTSDKAADSQTRRWYDEMAAGRTPGVPTLPRGVTASPTDDVLIIPTREVAAAKFTETREDMQVMLNILREKLSEPRMILGTLYDYGDFFGGDRGMKAVYFQGYAVLFLLPVDFPLLPATGAPGQNEQGQKEPADPVWQKAREKLYAPPAPTRYGRPRATGEAQEMSFEQFRDELVNTLKHAANIRNIEPNEWVILTVIGQSGEERFYAGGMMGGMGGYGGGAGGMGGYGGGGVGGMAGFSGGGGMMGGMGGGYGGGNFYSSSSSYSSSSATTGRNTGRRVAAPAAGATVLTLQAKKADIDAFARGSNPDLASIYGQDYASQPGGQKQESAKPSLTFEQFQQKVKVFTY